MNTKKESAQLLQQLNAQNPLRGASGRSAPIVTHLRQVMQTVTACGAVFAALTGTWLALGALEWLYHAAPLPTVGVLMVILIGITAREIIYNRRDD